MKTSIIMMIAGASVIVLGVALRVPGPPESAAEWKRMLRRGSTRDHSLFLLVPATGILMFSTGIMLFSQAMRWDALTYLFFPVALFSFVAMFIWGIFTFPYPLALAPKWFQPVKAGERERQRQERQHKKDKKRKSMPRPSMNIPPLNAQEKAQWASLTNPMVNAQTQMQHGQASFLFSERDELLPKTEPVIRKRMFKEPQTIEQAEPGRYVHAYVNIRRERSPHKAPKSGSLELSVASEPIKNGRALPETDSRLTTLGYMQPDHPENLTETDNYVLAQECNDPETIRAAVVHSLRAVGLRPQDVIYEQLG